MQKYRAKVNISTGEIPHRLAGWHRKVNTVTLLTHTSHNMATATTINVVSPIYTSNLHATFVDLIKKNTVQSTAVLTTKHVANFSIPVAREQH